MRRRPSHHAFEGVGGPPAEKPPPYSTVMIVTSSLPFQLGTQFHPCVPRESQPHHLRLESPNRHPPLIQTHTHTIHASGPLVLQCRLPNVIGKCDRIERSRREQAARQRARALHREMCR